MIRNNQARRVKIAVRAIEAVAVGLIVYLAVLPFYPKAKYSISRLAEGNRIDYQDETAVKEETDTLLNALPEAETVESENRIIIPKIGVNAPIVESASSEYGLSRGSWRVPESSTPNQGGNTVLTGHRFKYLPPNNLTFYLFDKLERGDIFAVKWNNENYLYRISEIKRVDAADLSILNQTDRPIVTLFTCDPIYSTEHRLVVIGELIDQ